MRAKSVVVIGAGAGGIAAAAHLARQGLHVTVVEKNSRPGGRCDRYVRDGHCFDTGPTLFVMPLMYEAEFRALGTSMHERLDLLRVDPTYHLVFDDGSGLSLTSDMKAMRDQLESFEPGSFAQLLRYMGEGERHYRLVQSELVNRDFRKVTDLLNLRNTSLISRLKPFVNHYQNMSGYFDDPRLKSAFTFQDIYVGLSPFDSPATFSMMPFTELAHGVWYPRGGMYAVVDALVGIAREAGVEFIFDSAVERIDVSATGVRGVILAGGVRLEAAVVLANADLPYVYEHLLPDDPIVRSLSRKRYSTSAISFFWGLDKPYPELAPHTLFLADDFRQNFESIDREHGLPENPSLYIHAPVRLDASMAPPGQDSVTAIIPVGHMNGEDDERWDALRDKGREHVFRRLRTLGVTDLESHIKFEAAYTPVSWRKHYNLMNGSTHGLSHALTQMAYFRPANRHRRYGNLYFAGASTHPGTGLPTAMVGARLVARRIMEEQGG